MSKRNGFVTKGFSVLTNFTDKVSLIGELIYSNDISISMMTFYKKTN